MAQVHLLRGKNLSQPCILMDQSAFVWRFNHKQHYLLLSVDNCWHAHHTSMPFGMWFAIAYNCFITYNYLSVQNIRIQLWWIVVVWWWWCECDGGGVSVLIISSSRLHILKHFIYSYVECHRVQKHQNNNTSNTWILHTVWNDEPTIHWILCVPQIPSFSHLCAICSFVFVTLFASIGNM